MLQGLFNLQSRILRKKWALEWALRIWGGKKILANYFLSRSLSIGVPLAYTLSVFEKIRSLEDWVKCWYRLGVQCEGMAQAAQVEGLTYTATNFWLITRAVFHMTQFPFYGHPELKQKIYRRSALAYREAAPYLEPKAQRFEIPFRSVHLPGYFRQASGDGAQTCLIILGGIDGVKEETHYYGEYFVKRGFSVFYFDAPGLGESWDFIKLDPNFQELGEAVFKFIEMQWPGQFSNISLLGISLGANQAIHMAASSIPFRSCVVVSPPFTPRAYFHTLSFLVQSAAAHIVGGPEFLNDFMERISLKDIAPKVRCPILVIGGAQDSIIPGSETLKVFEAVPQPKKLIFYPDGTHVCPEHTIEMLWEIEKWLKNVDRV